MDQAQVVAVAVFRGGIQCYDAAWEGQGGSCVPVLFPARQATSQQRVWEGAVGLGTEAAGVPAPRSRELARSEIRRFHVDGGLVLLGAQLLDSPHANGDFELRTAGIANMGNTSSQPAGEGLAFGSEIEETQQSQELSQEGDAEEDEGKAQLAAAMPDSQLNSPTSEIAVASPRSRAVKGRARQSAPILKDVHAPTARASPSTQLRQPTPPPTQATLTGDATVVANDAPRPRKRKRGSGDSGTRAPRGRPRDPSQLKPEVVASPVEIVEQVTAVPAQEDGAELLPADIQEQPPADVEPVEAEADGPEPQAAPAKKKRKLSKADEHMLEIASRMARDSDVVAGAPEQVEVEDTPAQARRKTKRRRVRVEPTTETTPAGEAHTTREEKAQTGRVGDEEPALADDADVDMDAQVTDAIDKPGTKRSESEAQAPAVELLEMEQNAVVAAASRPKRQKRKKHSLPLSAPVAEIPETSQPVREATASSSLVLATQEQEPELPTADLQPAVPVADEPQSRYEGDGVVAAATWPKRKKGEEHSLSTAVPVQEVPETSQPVREEASASSLPVAAVLATQEQEVVERSSADQQAAVQVPDVPHSPQGDEMQSQRGDNGVRAAATRPKRKKGKQQSLPMALPGQETAATREQDSGAEREPAVPVADGLPGDADLVHEEGEMGAVASQAVRQKRQKKKKEDLLASRPVEEGLATQEQDSGAELGPAEPVVDVLQGGAELEGKDVGALASQAVRQKRKTKRASVALPVQDIPATQELELGLPTADVYPAASIADQLQAGAAEEEDGEAAVASQPVRQKRKRESLLAVLPVLDIPATQALDLDLPTADVNPAASVADGLQTGAIDEGVELAAEASRNIRLKREKMRARVALLGWRAPETSQPVPEDTTTTRQRDGGPPSEGMRSIQLFADWAEGSAAKASYGRKRRTPQRTGALRGVDAGGDFEMLDAPAGVQDLVPEAGQNGQDTEMLDVQSGPSKRKRRKSGRRGKAPVEALEADLHADEEPHADDQIVPELTVVAADAGELGEQPTGQRILTPPESPAEEELEVGPYGTDATDQVKAWLEELDPSDPGDREDGISSEHAPDPVPEAPARHSPDVQKKPPRSTRKPNIERTTSVALPVPLHDGPESGAFTDAEKSAADAVFDYVCQNDGGLRAAALKAIIATWANAGEFKAEMRDVLPNRKPAAVRKFCQRRYTSDAKGEWTAEEDEALRRAYAAHPNKWSAISAAVDRSAQNCRDRWRDHVQYGKSKVVGPWLEAEEKALAEGVRECVRVIREAALANGDGALAGDVERMEGMVDWASVVRMLGGKRSMRRYRERWAKLRRREAEAGSMERTGAFVEAEDETVLDLEATAGKTKAAPAPFNRLSRKQQAVAHKLESFKHGDYYDVLFEITSAIPDHERGFSLESTLWSVVAMENKDSRFSGPLRRRAFYAAVEKYKGGREVAGAETIVGMAAAMLGSLVEGSGENGARGLERGFDPMREREERRAEKEERAARLAAGGGKRGKRVRRSAEMVVESEDEGGVEEDVLVVEKEGDVADDGQGSASAEGENGHEEEGDAGNGSQGSASAEEENGHEEEASPTSSAQPTPDARKRDFIEPFASINSRTAGAKSAGAGAKPVHDGEASNAVSSDDGASSAGRGSVGEAAVVGKRAFVSRCRDRK
ncbi:hypothetical protein LTR08_000862 [Meristemomyces frigidus]|nr:hypothetical protein LTR08_000862 [Meristemomyces frigidus]